MQPLVSVITTVFNREKYIEDSIKSILASTYQNFELIIVDDRSTDNSYKIAKSWEQKDPRIRVYLNDENLGDYPNRNKASEYAKGKYIKYVDADDMIYPHCLEVLVRDMEANPHAALGISIQDNTYKLKPYFLDPTQAIRTNYLDYEIFIVSPLSTIIRRKEFEEIGKFSGKRHVSDQELWFKMAMKYGALIITAGLVFWRSHGDQQSAVGRGTPRGIIARFYMGDEVLKLSKTYLSDSEWRNIYKLRSKKYAKVYFRKLLFDKDFRFAADYKKGIKKSFFKLFQEAFLY